MGYLKTLLAITVIIDHSPYGKAFVGGQFAVQLFYIISGFLIAHVLRTNPAYKNPFKFYLNRSLRIYPIYFAVSIATIIYIYAVDRSIFLFYFEIPAAAKLLLAVSNLTIFGQDWVMFSGIREGDLVFLVDFRKSIPQLWSGLLIPQAWTLGVELTFYAIAPFILRNTRLTILLLLLSCSIRLLTINLGFGSNDPWSYRFFPSELSLFLLGALSNCYLLPFWEKRSRGHGLFTYPNIATASLLLCCLFFGKIPLSWNIKVGFLLLSFAALLPLTFIFQQRSKLDKVIGELSYPIYIVHMLAIWLIKSAMSVGEVTFGKTSETVLCISFSCIMAYCLNATISTRVEKLRSRVRLNRNAT